MSSLVYSQADEVRSDPNQPGTATYIPSTIHIMLIKSKIPTYKEILTTSAEDGKMENTMGEIPVDE